MKILTFLLFFLLPFSLKALTTTTVITALSNSGIPSSQPQIAEAANGYALAVWTSGLAPNQTIAASTFFPANGVWVGPVTVGTGNSPQIGIDANDNGVAVWVNPTLNPPQIQGAYYNANTAHWSTPVTISNTPITANTSLFGTTNTFPKVAVNSTGQAYVVWVNQFTGTIQAASFTPPTTAHPSGVWSLPLSISTGTGALPTVGISKNGTGIATWQDFGSGSILTIGLSP